MPPLIDITGQEFGRLTVVKQVAKKLPLAYWECICVCGKQKTASGEMLRRGKVKSCGCLAQEIIKNGLIHGMAKSGKITPEYRAWSNMIYRCHNPNSALYKNYGGRGIMVCAEWKKSFLQFYQDMGNKPSAKHSIDRIDNNGNYTPENCRWATWSTQAINKRKNQNATSIYKNVHWDKKNKKWQASGWDGEKKINLGAYALESEAHQAALEFKKNCAFWVGRK